MTAQKKFLALRADSKFTPVGQEIDLAKTFSYRYHRKVNRDNTLTTVQSEKCEVKMHSALITGFRCDP